MLRKRRFAISQVRTERIFTDFHPCLFDTLGFRFLDELAARNDHLIRCGIKHILLRRPAEHTLRQRGHDLRPGPAPRAR